MKKKFQKKLSLNKEKIANLNEQEMEKINLGGGVSVVCPTLKCVTRLCTRCADECNCTGGAPVGTGCQV
jgi:hypothetical protein